MKSWPLKLRLSLLIGAVLLATIVTICSVAYEELKESLVENIDSTLKMMADGVLADLEEDKSDEAHRAKFHEIATSTDKKLSAQYRIWRDSDERDMFSSEIVDDAHNRLLTDLPPKERPEIGDFVFFSFYKNEKSYRAVWTCYADGEGIVNIALVCSSHYLYHEMGEFLKLLLILGGSLMLLVLFLVPRVISLGMRPMDQVADVLRQVTYKELRQEDLNSIQTPEELLPFIEALSEMLARLNKFIQQQKQFTANASHEFRTPLAVIKSTIQTTRLAKRDSADYIKALDDILLNVNRLERLIEQLLSLSKMDEGGGIPVKTRISLDALLADLTDRFDAMALRQGGKVVCDDCPELWINGNEGELVQMFSNILDNAIKHGPAAGTVRISISQDADRITVCVHDEGGAIPPSALPFLFNRFYRVESSRSWANGGVGLGLAIASEIAHHHGGNIEVLSDPQNGTSVFVRLAKQ
jgi:signal transduction histidine kinase